MNSTSFVHELIVVEESVTTLNVKLVLGKIHASQLGKIGGHIHPTLVLNPT